MDSKQTGLPDLDRISGSQLRQVRNDLGLSQSQLADLFLVSKSAVNLCEAQDRVVPPEWIEKLRFLCKYRSFATKIHMPKKRHWRFSKNFSRTPDFEVLPNCHCTIEKCRLDPEKDVDRGDLGHFWLFRGRECKKRRYLNEDGSIVQAPPSLRRKAEVPVERCSLCGKAREVKTRTTPKYPSATFYTLYCRGQASKHDPPVKYWRVDGKLQQVPPTIIESLSSRLNIGFEVPVCEASDCVRFGKRMEFSGRRGSDGKVLVFRCRASKKHVVFRGPSGEVAERLGFSHFRLHDLATGEVKEVRTRMGPKTDGLVVPHINCPTHQVGLLKVWGPYRNKRTKKDTWGFKCPLDGDKFRFDGTLRTAKLPGRVSQGRPSRLTSATQTRLAIAVELEMKGVTKWKISAVLYPKIERNAAYANTKKFLRRYRRLINSMKKSSLQIQAESHS